MSKNKHDGLDEENKNTKTGKVHEGGASRGMSSDAFREDVWEEPESSSCAGGDGNGDRTSDEESPLAFVTNWFSGLRWFNGGEDAEKGERTKNTCCCSGSGENGGMDDFKDDFRRNWKKYAIGGLVLLILFNVVWTLMESRIGSISGDLARQTAAVEEIKKDLEAVKGVLAEKVAAMDEALKGATSTIEGLQASLAEFDRNLDDLDGKVSDDRLVLAKHEGYLRQFVADRKAELRKYSRDLRAYEILLAEGASMDVPSVPMIAVAPMVEESVGPVKSTLQLTQDSLSITRDTLAITRDSLEKTRADLLKKEKDNAALNADLDRARKELLALESKVVEFERKYKDQSLDLSRIKADFAVSEKETSDLKLEIAKTQGSLKEEMDKAQKALTEKTAELDRFRASLAEKDEQVKSLEAKIAELGESVAAKDGEIASMKEEVSKVKDDVVAKARDLSEKSGLLETTKKEFADMQDASAKLKEDFEKAVAEKDALLAEAQSKIDGLVAKLREAEGLSDKTGEEVESLKQALEAKQAELADAIRSISAHEERQKALEEKLAVLEKEVAGSEAGGSVENEAPVVSEDESMENETPSASGDQSVEAEAPVASGDAQPAN